MVKVRWCKLPEISSSSSSDWKLLLFSQVGGEYFFLVTYWRPMVLLALFTRFLERVLKQTKEHDVEISHRPRRGPPDESTRTCASCCVTETVNGGFVAHSAERKPLWSTD